MRIAALDVGTKYIGIALTDEMGIIPQPFKTYRRNRLKDDLNFFDDFVLKYNIKKLIIGYPLHMDGQESQMSMFIKKFFYKLRHRWPQTKVILWDERLTTEEAEKIIAINKKKIRENKILKDKIAASLILKNYLYIAK